MMAESGMLWVVWNVVWTLGMAVLAAWIGYRAGLRAGLEGAAIRRGGPASVTFGGVTVTGSPGGGLNIGPTDSDGSKP
jgi:hypothetical protein